MKFYNGLSKEKVLKIYKFVMEKRTELRYGQRKLYRLVIKEFGSKINESTIAGWVFRKIKPFENEKTQFKSKEKPKREELYNLYNKEKISAEKLAKKYNVSTATLINWIKYYGMIPRTHLESMNTLEIKKELREKRLRKPTKEFVFISPEKAYVLGVLCGDGCVCKGMIRLEIRKDEEFIKEFADCIKKVYGLDFNYNYYPRRDSFVFYAHSEIVYNDLIRYGKFGTFDWYAPREIMECDNEKIICSFLRGIFDSEGCVSKSAILMSSANKKGIKEVKFLLRKIGIESKIGLYKDRYYLLWIFRKERFKIFREKVGLTIKRKQEKLNKILENGISYKPA